MDLYFFGHDYKYAAEQLLLTLFPLERPVYPTGRPEGDRAEISRQPAEMVCRLYRGGEVFVGSAGIDGYADERERISAEQRAVKLCFYRAALASGVERPVWGALTGVKPGKLMARYLSEGRTASDFAADFDVRPDRAALCERTARYALGVGESLEEGDVGLYVGIPFCPTRCAYCSFVSSAVGTGAKLVEPYLEALTRELRQEGARARESGLRPVALYIGGGTPTILTAEQLDRLCGTLRESFPLSALREFTVEAGRPDTITAEKLEILKANGVTRVSVNPQTMSDGVLRAVGRPHTARDVLDAFTLVRRSGDFQINMDLIAGLPADTEEGFAQTLDKVLSLAPENITVHTLAIKNGSYLAEHPTQLPEAAAVGRMLETALARLPEAGYEPYYLYRQKYMSGGFENVGWTRPGCVNLYNVIMMEELCPVLAMGAGGSTKLTAPDGSVRRRINPKYPKEYIERIMSR